VADHSTGAAWIAVIGDRHVEFAAQDAIEPAIEHAAAGLAVACPAVRWIDSDVLAARGGEVLEGATGVWCPPGSPFRDLDGVLAGIRWARERGVPFLGTCGGFQHGVIEFARNVLGQRHAAHPDYEQPDGELFIAELLCALVDQTMRVDLVDAELRAIYGADSVEERYYCRFGLRPSWRAALHEAGLATAGVDRLDGDARILRLADHRWYVLTLFVPQLRSRPGAPHPLITRFVRAAVGDSDAQKATRSPVRVASRASS
jgi:CTP synthase (UTP-ammonia lyase)